MTNAIACVIDGAKFVPIKEMWESYTGWYWFITEVDKEDPDYAYGYVVGFEKEWGGISRDELKSLRGQVWQVPKKNWFSNSHVHMVEAKLVG